MPCMLFLLLSMIIVSAGLTDLDYRLGKSKYSESSITEDEGFHGSSSARLSVADEGNYVRITVYMDEPLPIEELDQLSLWTDPKLGDANIQIEMFLDGDGDDSYDSDSQEDARLQSLKESWSEMGMSPFQWNELDGFDLSYEKYGDEDFGYSSLDECKSALKGRSVVKLYITIYKDPSVKNTVAYIDYIKIGNQIISFEPLEKEEIKSAPRSVSPGSEITYTITYGNNLLEPADLVIRESYDSRTVFVMADPEPDPGTTNVWTMRNLPPGKHGQIIVKVRTGKMACKADIKGGVSGKGYTAVKSHLSTDLSGYTVTNRVLVLSEKFNLTASASTAVRPVEGSIIDFKEHGAGFYSSEERLGYSPSRVFIFRDMNASRSFLVDNISYANTSPGYAALDSLFSGLINNSNWHASRLCENRVLDVLLKDEYTQENNLSLSSHAYASKTSSYLETASSFSGMAEHVYHWRDAAYVEWFAGNFTTTSDTRLRVDKRTKRLDKEALECCPEMDE